LHAYFAGTERVRKVMIVGGGAVGYMVARELEKSGVELVLIETDEKRAAWLSEQLSRTLVLQGDGTDLELLEAEGIEETDVLVAVTNNDEKNLLVSLLAKQVGVEKVITRVGRSENRPLFERVGIDIPLTPRQAAVREVIHHLTPGGVEHLAVIEDKVELIEVPVAEAFAGRRVGELELPAKAVVVAVLRPRTVELARPELELRKGDRILALTPRELTEEVARALGQAP
ncbi:MAG TPA: Trk system potassium transporter TrkA, partial [Oceanithermus sp.]|nr:Trk system potassium transporter TrkA [Oceanithermus sp.]